MLALIHYKDLPAPYAIVALIIASVPPTKASVALANQYNMLYPEASMGTVVMTILSLLTVSAWILIANALWPDYFLYHIAIS